MLVAEFGVSGQVYCKFVAEAIIDGKRRAGSSRLFDFRKELAVFRRVSSQQVVGPGEAVIVLLTGDRGFHFVEEDGAGHYVV